jgi:hypothetical protein
VGSFVAADESLAYAPVSQLNAIEAGRFISRKFVIHSFPSSMPEVHRRFLSASIDVLEGDSRIVGIAVGGSFLTDSMDESLREVEARDVLTPRCP